MGHEIGTLGLGPTLVMQQRLQVAGQLEGALELEAESHQEESGRCVSVTFSQRRPVSNLDRVGILVF